MGLGYTYTSEAVPNIRFPDAVALTEAAEGMAGRSPGLISSCGR